MQGFLPSRPILAMLGNMVHRSKTLLGEFKLQRLQSRYKASSWQGVWPTA